MYLMYVDESGDTGRSQGSSTYFMLTGIVIHETQWKAALTQLINFRKALKKDYGLRLRDEIHAADLITRPGADLAKRINKATRLLILRRFVDEIDKLPGVSIINVVVTKSGKRASYDPFDMAWKALIQRLENTIANQNFPVAHAGTEFGMIFPDDTSRKKLRLLLRKMGAYNPIPNAAASFGSGYRDLPLTYVIEDPHYKDSEHSYFIQAADCVAYLLYQKHAPNKYMRTKGGANYFNRLKGSLCTVAASLKGDPQGIVRL